MSDYDTRAAETREAIEYGRKMGEAAALAGRPPSATLGVGTRGHVSPRSLKLFKAAYSAAYNQAARQKNPWPWSRKKKAAASPARKLRSSMSIAQASRAAFTAGQASGNQHLAGEWVDDRFGDRSSSIVARLEADYKRGVYAKLQARKKADEKKHQAAERVRLRAAELEEKRAARLTPLASYDGVKLWKRGTGEVITSLDKDSEFDDVRQARRFIDSYRQNPRLSGAPRRGAKVKILGHTVTVGTKRHAALVAQKKQFDDLQRSETGRGRKNPNYTRYPSVTLRLLLEAPAQQVGDAQKKQIRAELAKRAKNPGRRNPESAAAELSEKFHGRPADMVRLIIEKLKEHSVLTELAALVQIVVETPTGLLAEMDFKLAPEKDVVYLASSEDGKQLYFRGGDQEANLKAMKMDGPEWVRDNMELGRLAKFTYRTKKKMHEFKLIDYWHLPGEETGYRPIVTYDYRNKALSLAGGQYFVDAAGVIN